MSDEQFKCIHCNKKFKSVHLLGLHNMNFDHIEDTLFCDICNSNLPLCASMSIHLDSHPLCSICLTRFESTTKLALHKIKKHFDSVPRTLYFPHSYGKIICFICGHSFKEAALADIHIKVRHFILKIIFKKTKK
jgi:hypothetical protein